MTTAQTVKYILEDCKELAGAVPGIWERIDTELPHTEMQYAEAGQMRPFVEEYAARQGRTLPSYRSLSVGSLQERFAALAGWRRNKVVFSFSEEMEELLTEQAEEADPETLAVPVQILTKLPYTNFFVATERTPLKTAQYYKRTEPVHETFSGTHLGYFVYFEQDKNNRFYLCVTSVVLQQGHLLYLGSRLPLVNGTLSDVIRNYISQAGLGQAVVDTALPKLLYSWSVALQFLLYLCAENREVEQEEENRQYYRKTEPARMKEKMREVKLLQAGKQTGQRLRQFQKGHRVHCYTVREGSSSDIDAGKGAAVQDGRRNSVSKAPHVRCGHFHHYWTGKRNSVERTQTVRWIAPTFIHPEQMEQADVAVVKVRNTADTSAS